MQVVLKWHQWQQIQTTLRWSRASGWGQNNISYIFRSNVFLTEKFDICFPRWASMTRRTRPPWENAFVEIFYFFMFLSLFLYQTMELPSQTPNIYLQTFQGANKLKIFFTRKLGVLMIRAEMWPYLKNLFWWEMISNQSNW